MEMLFLQSVQTWGSFHPENGSKRESPVLAAAEANADLAREGQASFGRNKKVLLHEHFLQEELHFQRIVWVYFPEEVFAQEFLSRNCPRESG